MALISVALVTAVAELRLLKQANPWAVRRIGALVNTTLLGKRVLDALII